VRCLEKMKNMKDTDKGDNFDKFRLVNFFGHKGLAIIGTT